MKKNKKDYCGIMLFSRKQEIQPSHGLQCFSFWISSLYLKAIVLAGVSCVTRAPRNKKLCFYHLRDNKACSQKASLTLHLGVQQHIDYARREVQTPVPETYPSKNEVPSTLAISDGSLSSQCKKEDGLMGDLFHPKTLVPDRMWYLQKKYCKLS